jgi:hypothetical protein
MEVSGRFTPVEINSGTHWVERWMGPEPGQCYWRRKGSYPCREPNPDSSVAMRESFINTSTRKYSWHLWKLKFAMTLCRAMRLSVFFVNVDVVCRGIVHLNYIQSMHILTSIIVGRCTVGWDLKAYILRRGAGSSTIRRSAVENES